MCAVRNMRRRVESSEATDMCDRILLDTDPSSDSEQRDCTGEVGILDLLFDFW